MRDIVTVIQENITLYLDFIKSLANSSRIHHFSNKNGGFPILLGDNKAYNEQSYFEELIENCTWRYLVNGIMRGLFSEEYCASKKIICEWQYMHMQLTGSYVEEIEKRFPIEFIITRNEKREGYRYTNCYYSKEKLTNLFESNKIEKLFIIDFSSEHQSSFLHPLSVPKEYRDVVERITLKDFFICFFSEAEYSIYISKVNKAVAESYKFVGLQTVTNLTNQYLPFFLESEMSEIKNFPYSEKTYVVLNSLKHKASMWYGDGVISLGDKQIINDMFMKRYRALIGREHFAKSFLTSEYLYHTMKYNNRFDYTAIVSGYLKSIEQLLYRILEIVMIDGHTEDVWIQSRGRNSQNHSEFRTTPGSKGGRSQVKVRSANKAYFDTSFAAMVHMLKDYNNGWGISEKSSGIVSAYLLTFCDECRNEHFHKDNISDIEEVEKIRDNTFMLLYYVIGGYNFSIEGQDEEQLLGIIDTRFDKMYRAIMRFGSGNYYLLSFGSDKPVFVALPSKQEEPIYDEDGVIRNPSLRFVKLFDLERKQSYFDSWEDIQNEYSDEKTIILTPENMPTKISYYDKITEEKISITW